MKKQVKVTEPKTPKMSDLFSPAEIGTCPAEYRGEVLILNPARLKPGCADNRLNYVWKACGGFGCDSQAMGRAVFAVCAADGEEARWDRHDFIAAYKGVLPDDAFTRKPIDYGPDNQPGAQQPGQYWIQEQAPAGNYFDSIGLCPGTPETKARQELADWVKASPARKCRLVFRVDTVIAS